MEVRPELQLQVMIKAMVDVVLPAVDPTNKMALEQANLVIATLKFIAKRLPISYRFDRDELDRYVALARDLVSQTDGKDGGAIVGDLKSLAERGGDALERARAEPSELETLVIALRERVGALVQAVYDGTDMRAQAAVQRLVLKASKLELDRERAFIIDLGFDLDPTAAPPPIETLLPPVNASPKR